MKKLLAITILVINLFSLCACGSNDISSTTSPTKIYSDPVTSVKEINEEASVPEVEENSEDIIEAESLIKEEESNKEITEEANEEEDLVADIAELEAIGDVEVENNILTVSVTLPADFVSDEVTQDSLDANAGNNYQSAKINEDRSVTYKMTKAQHRIMLDGIAEGLNQSLQDMVDDETYSISKIEFNNNYSVFDVYMDNDTVGFSDSFAVIALYFYGGIYSIFSGDKADKIVVNFWSPSGILIESANSADIGN